MTTDRQLANAIRALSMDAVQKANSGHPGAPMGMADMALVLWRDFLRHNPGNPDWPNRDRFVLSNGHGSMLLYSLLHLTGYDVSIDDIQDFRQMGSKTPGHPEYGDTPGVETTTGPLGQGLANGVGMALAEKLLAARFNQEKAGQSYQIVDHHTYVFAGDGCLMEGISHEVASLAGTLGLGKLICLYDDNGISIDGEVSGWFGDDTPARFNAYGWQVIPAVDGHDAAAVGAALKEARADLSRPTLICCRTQIGFGSPNKAGKASSHGSPLGEDEIAATRQQLGWEAPPFEISADIYSGWDCRAKGAEHESHWRQQFSEYQQAFPEIAAEFERTMAGNLPADFADQMAALMQEIQAEGKSLASRNASGEILAKLGRLLPELTGGSADLSGSNCTFWDGAQPISAEDASGNYVYYGVREFGMTAIANGMALHGGIRPYTGTFLIFMEYARNAVRMSALMGIPNIHVYTHDSIGQGEDGPTHQPVEQLTNLRTTPDLSVWRPCDKVETLAAWQAALQTSGPSALVFSRQSLPHQDRDESQLADIAKGGYILETCDGTPDIILIATGSEVGICREATRQLIAEGVSARLVSMPSTDVFAAQTKDYQEEVLPNQVRCRLAVEAAHGEYWYRWVGLDGDVISLNRFGASGPGGEVMSHFGFSVPHVVERAKALLAS